MTFVIGSQDVLATSESYVEAMNESLLDGREETVKSSAPCDDFLAGVQGAAPPSQGWRPYSRRRPGVHHLEETRQLCWRHTFAVVE